MTKTITLTVQLRDDVNPHDFTDAGNEFLRHPGVYALIADDDDDGWAWQF